MNKQQIQQAFNAFHNGMKAERGANPDYTHLESFKAGIAAAPTGHKEDRNIIGEMARALALIDEALGISEDDTGGVDVTLDAIEKLKARLAAASGNSTMKVVYARQSELAKLADNRIAGVGMMLHKEQGEGMAPVFYEETSKEKV